MRTVAKRYAKALAIYCKENGVDFEETYNNLKKLEEILLQNDTLFKYFTTPIASQTEKIKLANEFVQKLDLPDFIKNFFLLTVEKNRLIAFPLIVEEFRFIADELQGQVRGVLKVAMEITDQELKELQDAISEKLGKKVVLEVEEDPSIIGGAIAYVGGMVFDGSIKGNLEVIKEKLVER